MLKRYSRCLTAIVPALLLILAASLFGGCAADKELTDEQVAALEQRVRERWARMAEHDFAGAWEYMTPEYRRIIPKELFVHKFSYALEWELTGVEVVHYDARAAVASVVARVMTRSTKLTKSTAMGFGAVPRDLREQWMLIDGEWWYSANDHG